MIEILIQRLGKNLHFSLAQAIKTSYPRSLMAAAASLGILTTGMLSGCNAAKPKAAAPPPVPVTVAKVTTQDVPVQLEAIGSVQAISTVSIRALVGGELKTVGFKQGDMVHKGQVLFTIDPQPYQAALAQAEGNLSRDLANLNQAASQAKRYADLEKLGVVSKEQNEQIQATANATDSAVRTDRAAVDSAKLNLSYCTIVAPIDGRTGSLLVQAGNLVQPNTTILVTLNQIAPIYVSFSVPEQYLPQLKAARTPGVSATAQGDTIQDRGTLTFINNTIDSTTGTINLMATFPNGNEHLWPGEYVNTNVGLSVINHATVVPATAVLTGQSNMYVYKLTPKGTVQPQTVTTSITVGPLTVITSGLSDGETVVTDGQLALSPGAKVLVRGRSQPDAGGKASTK